LFQFHFGTIRRDEVFVIRTEKESFNSTLVRLEVPYETYKVMLDELFQFHFGTIRSEKVEIISKEDDVSIPLWYD